jgi:uncharacterized membrane protein YfcA
MLGKNFDGQLLMFLFAFVMVAVGVAMLRPRSTAGDPGVRINPAIAARLLSVGFVTGLLSGFFGIGGGFLIVPGMLLGSGCRFSMRLDLRSLQSVRFGSRPGELRRFRPG